jgi:hypothetical protein
VHECISDDGGIMTDRIPDDILHLFENDQVRVIIPNEKLKMQLNGQLAAENGEKFNIS